MEFLKTYDRQHNYIETVSRQIAHEKQYQFYHETVHIIVKSDKNNILVQKRSRNKLQHPSLYDLSATGHVSSDDDLLSACQRELFEEIGLNLNTEDFKLLETIIDDDNKEFINIFLCDKEITEDYPFVLQQEEVESVRFLSSTEFIDLILSDDYSPYFDEYKSKLIDIVKHF